MTTWSPVDPVAEAFGRAMVEQSTDGVTTVATSAAGGVTLETLSTRADAVTGGDVLLRVGGDLVDPPDPGEATLTVDGEVAELLAQEVAAPGTQVGLLEGLSDGDHLIEYTVGGETAALAVTNHPIAGPVFAGPHLEPWICHTEDAGLGAPRDEDCTVDVQTTTETVAPVDGPEIEVTIERGVIDRGIYTLWMPADATDWNGRLVYRFGGGCGTTYGQGFDLGSGVDADLLSRGYALATNTLDTFQTICNPMVSAEAALMTRERFVESYGVPEFTIGDGGSGGAIQQLLIAQNQPGLLDALSPAAPFPDALSISPGVSDCRLLVDYYGTPSGRTLTEDAAGRRRRPPHVGHLRQLGRPLRRGHRPHRRL